ncbi:ribonuclease PH [candidate division TA06 bacterium DG_78]|uniref:Ribonuclease PH n=1 Tax=candidate division TA06 bacterium DG_78 TaxID=1703772 RepID=A0A0S7YG29_UNCT6|nr:MAG: ribonuclease PH [candidate division TA06 bacterium DG_78]
MRSDGRKPNQLREMKIDLDYLEYRAGSCLIRCGKTQVLCAVTVENRVPPFLLGKGQGWLTAEYSLLPSSTKERTQREANKGRLNGRTQEVRRFIGRSLRPIFNLHFIGERTFIIDCDVIQADGGTRTAAVNGAFIALSSAVNKMMVNKEFSTFPILDYVAATSVGIVNNQMMLDLDYEEDSNAEIDMNLVMTGRGKFIEVQATAEKMPISRKEFDQLLELGSTGIKEIIELEKKLLGSG